MPDHLPVIDLKLKTKPGIFSKDRVDLGSQLLINNLNVPTDRAVIADLGCGSGIIGLTLAKMNTRTHIHLLDSDIRAVELARENVEANKLRNAEVFLSDLFKSVDNRSYHQVISNPPQSAGNAFLDEIISESHKHLKINGEALFVVKRNLKNVMERAFRKYFENCTVIAQNKSFILLKGIKYA